MESVGEFDTEEPVFVDTDEIVLDMEEADADPEPLLNADDEEEVSVRARL